MYIKTNKLTNTCLIYTSTVEYVFDNCLPLALYTCLVLSLMLYMMPEMLVAEVRS